MQLHTFSSKFFPFTQNPCTISSHSEFFQIYLSKLSKVWSIFLPGWSTIMEKKILKEKRKKKEKKMSMCERNGEMSKRVWEEWKIQRKEENMSKQICKKKIMQGKEREKIIHVYNKMIYKTRHMIPIRIPHSDCWQFTTIQHLKYPLYFSIC